MQLKRSKRRDEAAVIACSFFCFRFFFGSLALSPCCFSHDIHFPCFFSSTSSSSLFFFFFRLARPRPRPPSPSLPPSPPYFSFSLSSSSFSLSLPLFFFFFKKKKKRQHVGGSKVSRSAHKAAQPARATRRTHVGAGIVAQHWDKSKTLRENMRSLGLAADANKAVPLPDEAAPETSTDAAAAGEAKPKSQLVQQLAELAASAPKRLAYVSEGEIIFMQRLVDKYGLDFKVCVCVWGGGGGGVGREREG